MSNNSKPQISGAFDISASGRITLKPIKHQTSDPSLISHHRNQLVEHRNAILNDVRAKVEARAKTL